MKKIILMCMVLSLSLLASCSESARWRKWQEEVPLNTGENIVVSRSQKWTMRSSYGAPSLKLRPSSENTLEFDYKGVKYAFSGNLQVGFIAISPILNRPVIIGHPGSFGWDSRNSYFCVVPHYVQLVPDATGKKWTWPERIEPWLYGLPKNIMGAAPGNSEPDGKTYSASERDLRDRHYLQNAPYAAKIDPTYKQNGCISRPPPPINRTTQP
jgi:hypothetical protein